MKLIKVIVATVFAFSSAAYADVTRNVEYITEDFPPYNFKGEDGQAHGLNADILVEMFKNMNASKKRQDIKVQPWARGYRAAQDNRQSNVLFSTTRTDAREGLFKWVGPLSDATNALITLKGNPHKIKIENQADFAKYKYGAIRDDVGEATLLNSGVPKANITSIAQFPQMVKLLQGKRVQAISYNGTVGQYLIKKHGFNPADFEIVYSKRIGQHYFAFNKSVDDNVIAEHQKALDAIKANQSLIDEINARYLK